MLTLTPESTVPGFGTSSMAMTQADASQVALQGFGLGADGSAMLGVTAVGLIAALAGFGILGYGLKVAGVEKPWHGAGVIVGGQLALTMVTGALVARAA